MREPTIAAGFARGLVDFAVSKGVSRPELAERSQIDLDALQDQDLRVPLTKYMTLMHAAKALTNEPALALQFGETVHMADLSIVGLIGQACETAAEAFAQLDRYNRLLIDVEVEDPEGRRLVLSPDAGRVWMVDTRKNPNAFPELTESSFARMVSSARRASPEKELMKAVHLTHAAPTYRDEYDRVFQMPVVFGSDKNALLMTDESFLEVRPPAGASRYVFGVLSERAEALLTRLETSNSTRARVESSLIPMLHTGEVKMEIVADELGMSRPTLFRRLKAEGTSFEKVLDDLRRQMALNYLSGQRVSVSETAYLVGFSDPASFSRAFKRWTGASPRAARKN